MNYNDIFDYNNGNLVWKRKKELTKWDRAWNTRNAGKVAGTKSEAEKAREEYNLMYSFHKNHGK